MKKNIRIGTRGSPLALLQSEIARAALLKSHPDIQETCDIELVPLRTGGDWRPDMAERSLGDMGANKGLFTKEIDEALMSGVIDVAVHSVKDMPTVLPDSLVLSAVLERGDPRDAFITRDGRTLADMPAGATIGSSSLRRGAQIMAQRPDLKIVPLRGNVETRLKKLDNGIADATILAVAGIQRLGLNLTNMKILEADTMLPSVGQGALGLVTRRGNDAIEHLIASLDHYRTNRCVTAERAFLRILDGSCRTPIAGLARLASDQIIVLEGLVARPDGSGLLRLQQSGKIGDAEAVGVTLGEEFKRRLPSDFFAH